MVRVFSIANEIYFVRYWNFSKMSGLNRGRSDGNVFSFNGVLVDKEMTMLPSGQGHICTEVMNE